MAHTPTYDSPLPGHIYESTTFLRTPSRSYEAGTQWLFLHPTNDNPFNQNVPPPHWYCLVEGRKSVWTSIPHCLEMKWLRYTGVGTILEKPAVMVHEGLETATAYVVRNDQHLFEVALKILTRWRGDLRKSFRDDPTMETWVTEKWPSDLTTIEEILGQEDGRRALHAIATCTGMEILTFFPLGFDCG